ncbi:MAG: hypothetical protein KF873_01925 [Gemmataceae bacterium]|nr:hypothetical protein [Gemmataceae bacterium]
MRLPVDLVQFDERQRGRVVPYPEQQFTAAKWRSTGPLDPIADRIGFTLEGHDGEVHRFLLDPAEAGRLAISLIDSIVRPIECGPSNPKDRRRSPACQD